MVTLTEKRGYLLMLDAFAIINAIEMPDGTAIATKSGDYIVEENVTTVLQRIVNEKNETRRKAESRSTHKSKTDPQGEV